MLPTVTHIKGGGVDSMQPSSNYFGHLLTTALYERDAETRCVKCTVDNVQYLFKIHKELMITKLLMDTTVYDT